MHAHFAWPIKYWFLHLCIHIPVIYDLKIQCNWGKMICSIYRPLNSHSLNLRYMVLGRFSWFHSQVLICHCQILSAHRQSSSLTIANQFVYKLTWVKITTIALVLQFRCLYKCPGGIANHVAIVFESQQSWCLSRNRRYLLLSLVLY